MDSENNSNETGALSAELESVQIVKGGDVGEDELAALVAGIVAASAVTDETLEISDASFGRARWVNSQAKQKGFPRHGRDAWRWSLHK